MELNALTEGQLFASRYRVVRCIASGGMGAVYEVTHTETDRRCALKVMLPHIVSNEALRERFKREARVTAHIGSEFIVDVLDAGVDDATQAPFLVMEYLEGGDLSVELERRGRLEPDEVVTYLWQASLALNKTHAANIVHRDLKPENLFLTRRDDGSPRVKILDFGISKVVEASTKGNATMTLGTPLYMAPEQFKGIVSPPTDLYALGMIAYTLLVGAPYWLPGPDEDESVFALATKIMDGIVEPASSRAARHNHQFPKGFDEWFAKVTAREVKDRFQTALEAVTALGRLFEIELKSTTGASASMRPPPPSPMEPVRAATSMTSAKDASGPQPSPSRSRTGLALGISGAVALVGVIAIVAVRMGSANPTVAGVVESVRIPLASSPSASPLAASAPPASANVSAALAPSASASSSTPSTAGITPPSANVGAKGAKPPITKTAATPETPTTQPPATSTGYSRY